MSGPVGTEDAPTTSEAPDSRPPVLEVTPSREAEVAGARVRRALPTKGRRTVGAWCFADHMGPARSSGDGGIGSHPHIGLQTVTWLLSGELLHRDSLGSEQLVRPGQLNLMTAGHGIAHAEEETSTFRGDRHGIQLWVAQPEATRHGAPAFEHHAELPVVEFESATASVLVGSLSGVTSPARRDTDHVGVDVALRRGTAALPVEPAHEHAVVVLAGATRVSGHTVAPGALAYLGAGRDELVLEAEDETRLLVLGGEPFAEPVLMWWNFVARTRDEMAAARADWEGHDPRFGPVESRLPRLDAWELPWRDDR